MNPPNTHQVKNEDDSVETIEVEDPPSEPLTNVPQVSGEPTIIVDEK